MGANNWLPSLHVTNQNTNFNTVIRETFTSFQFHSPISYLYLPMMPNTIYGSGLNNTCTVRCSVCSRYSVVTDDFHVRSPPATHFKQGYNHFQLFTPLTVAVRM